MKISRREFLKLMSLAPLAWVSNSPGKYLPKSNPVSLPDSQRDKQPPNILILVFDALSARNMSLYGYPRRTTPHLQEASASANVYHRHYAGGTFTSSGVGSLFTGTYPWTHRGYNVGGTVATDLVENNLFSLLAQQYHIFTYSHNNFVNLYFDQFKHSIDRWIPIEDLCLESVGINAGRLLSNDVMAKEAQGLLFWRTPLPSAAYFSTRFIHIRQQAMIRSLNQKYQEAFPRGVPNYTTIFFTIEQAVDWVLSLMAHVPRPFLGYVHLFPPHFPYNTRREYVDIFDDGWNPQSKPEHPLSDHYPGETLKYLRRSYDEFIAYVDAEFGRLFKGLTNAGVLDDTLLVFTSDHGEMFERGIQQHYTPTVFEPIIHIPLIVWRPSQREMRHIHTPTSCVDLLPTLLHLSNQPIPGWCEGQILPGFGKPLAAGERSVFVVDAKENPKYAPLQCASVALTRASNKIVRYFGYAEVPDRYEFYDLQADPDELVNLADDDNSLFVSLRQELDFKLEKSNRLYR